MRTANERYNLVPSFLTLVPSAPRNLTQTMDNSTESSIYLQWETPLSPNGVINRYQIAYRGLQTPNAVYIGNFTSTSLQLVDPPVTFFNLSGGLIPGSSYEISVQAATSAGLGPSSNRIVAVTAESGNLMHFVWSTVNTCQCILYNYGLWLQVTCETIQCYGGYYSIIYIIASNI